MKVTVEYAAQVKKATGKGGEDVELPDGSSLQELVHTIATQYSDEVSRVLLNETGQLHPSILVFVDDEQLRDSDALLADGQRVTFLSPISGG